MKTETEFKQRRYILSEDNGFYNLCDDNDRILFRTYNLSIILQYAFALRKNGHLIDVADNLVDELGQSLVDELGQSGKTWTVQGGVL